MRRYAIESAEYRGHILSRFGKFLGGTIRTGTHRHTTGLAHCVTHHEARGGLRSYQCRQWVLIDTNPPSNGIDIGGPAVAVNCRRG